MPHFLVTGGAGFIGSNIVEHLVARNERVRVLDDFSTGKRENLEPWLDRVELIEGSITSPEDCRRAVHGIDFVYHQAARASVPKSVEFPRETTESNVMGTVNMLTAARDAQVKRFTLAASSSVYGDTATLPKVETMTPRPLSPYAVQKLACEHMCRVFYQQYGLKTVILRYFNIFGPRQDPNSQYSAVVPNFIMTYLNNQIPTIFGDGRQSRDFTYVENVIAANLKACAADGGCAGQVMNIACGERIDLLRLAEVIRTLLGKAGVPRHEPERAGDVRDSLADITRAKELIGYEVSVPFAEGINRTIEWYRRSLL